MSSLPHGTGQFTFQQNRIKEESPIILQIGLAYLHFLHCYSYCYYYCLISPQDQVGKRLSTKMGGGLLSELAQALAGIRSANRMEEDEEDSASWSDE